jgi:hypothetical protein
MKSAAAQKCVLEYVSLSIFDVTFFEHDGHFNRKGFGPTSGACRASKASVS